MKCKHYFKFNNNFNFNFLNKNSWDLLRNSNENYFYIENSINEYEKNCINSITYKNSANYIQNFIDKYKINSITSLGCGKAILEWYIKKYNPNIEIVCTDFTTNGIDKLKKVFVDANNIFEFDIIKGNYNLLDKNTYLLFYRISTEFNINDWKKIFYNCYKYGIKNILFFSVDEQTTLSSLIKSIKIFFIRKLYSGGGRNVDCGWLYSPNEYKKMFNNYYNIIEEDTYQKMSFFLLSIKNM